MTTTTTHPHISAATALAAIYERRGVLTPATVVEEATPPDHPLHPRFTWDDREAGHAYRLVQAQQLIRQVQVTRTRPDGEEVRTRQWVALHRINGDPNQPDPTARYESLDVVLADPVRREKYLQAMRRDIAVLTRRYSHLQEFAGALRDALNELGQ